MDTPSSTPATQPALHPKMAPSEQKRLLALDGGGIRGMITVEVLARIEAVLRERTGGGADFRLADYFDYVAGTSTGAIIATCISLGMSVDEIRGFYQANGKAMFDKAGILDRLHNKYSDDKLADKLREVFDGYLPGAEGVRGRDHVTLGSSALRTLLLVVMRNATTDSPWPLSSNPRAKYNDPGRPDCNTRLPLWQLVRASTAAPTYFPPEEIVLGEHRFLFVDGGGTTDNNPAFLLFLMATARPYRLEWPTGADRMLLVSVGTGAAAKADAGLSASDMHLLYNAGTIPGALMAAALHEQDLLCRIFGRCRAGDMLDRELGTLCGTEGESDVLPKLFTYMRYNADLSRVGLDRLGLEHLAPDQVQRLDSIEFMPQLQEVGRAVGARVQPEHFQGFP